MCSTLIISGRVAAAAGATVVLLVQSMKTHCSSSIASMHHHIVTSSTALTGQQCHDEPARRIARYRSEYVVVVASV